MHLLFSRKQFFFGVIFKLYLKKQTIAPLKKEKKKKKKRKEKQTNKQTNKKEQKQNSLLIAIS